VFDGIIDSRVFGNFVENILHPYIFDKSYVVLDNAATHTPYTRYKKYFRRIFIW
jgi:hypothetical protein